jgi:long-chain acyl-CoA synthetase
MEAAVLQRPPLSAAERPWLSSYPPGVPAEIDTAAYNSLVALLEESFRHYAQRDAAVCMGERISFGEIDRLSQALAAWLQDTGLKRGDRVAIMMPNLPQYLVAISGILRAGLVVVNVNPLYTPRELAHQLEDSGALAIIVLENFAHTLAEVVKHTQVMHVILASVGDLLGPVKGRLVNFAVRHVKKVVPEFRLPTGPGRSVIRFNSVLGRGSALPFRRIELGPDDVAFLQYTGGTTGVSKGATLLHRNVVANILQAEAWFHPMLAKLSPARQFVTVCALPLYHIFA